MKFESITHRLLAVLALGLAFQLLGASVPAFAQTKDFVVAANGDPYETMWRKSLIPEFEKATGLRVVWSPGLSTQILAKVVSQRSNPQIDVAMLDEGPFIQGADLGLWESFQKAELGDLSAVMPAALAYDNGVAYGFSAVGLYYNTQMFEESGLAPPTSWLDLLKPEFNQKITMLSVNNSAGLNSLLALNQIAGGKIPDNLDPGFDLAKKFAQQALTIDSFGDTPQLIQQKAVVAGIWVYARVVGLSEAGVPIKFVTPKEGIWGHRFMAAIVKGRPPEHTAAAKKFLTLLLDKEQQTAALSLNPLPVHTGASQDAITMIDKLNLPDQRVIQKHRAAWTERWSKEIERR